jgi:hypothetical protein
MRCFVSRLRKQCNFKPIILHALTDTIFDQQSVFTKPVSLSVINIEM